jgi:hypothetical protein
MNKKASLAGIFILVLIISLLVIFNYTNNPTEDQLKSNIESLDDTTSLDTYIKSSYELAADCLLRFTGLNDAELDFTNSHPNTLDSSNFIESVMDDVFQNFTIFTGRTITKDSPSPNLILKQDSVELDITQKFNVKVDNKIFTINRFISSLPIPIKQGMDLRNNVLEGEDIELNKFYESNSPISIFNANPRSIILVDNDFKYLFVK